jgi:type IX secretion system PorP/SprF family membrane protein
MNTVIIHPIMKRFRRLLKKQFLLAATLLICGLQAQAQFEPQFTQYMFNEMFINPAYAGSREHIALTGLYRNQWVGIEGAPKTQTFSGHTPLRNEKVGLGLTVLNEEIGVTRDLGVFANYAYRIKMEHDAFFSLGLQGGIINHQEQLDEVKTQDQGDYAFFGTPKLTVPNAGFGAYYNSKTFYGGISIPRLFQNKVDANTGKAQNRIKMDYWHYYIMGGYVFPINENIKLKPTVMMKVVTGAPVEADLGVNALFNEVLWVGGSYRTGDSWSALIQIQLNHQFRLGYSYDYTLTDLSRYNSGTHEITLGYDFSFNKNKIITPRYF